MSNQESFSFLTPLSTNDVQAQIENILKQGWMPIIEYAEDATLEDFYWNLWPVPRQDEVNLKWVVSQIEACSRRYPFAHVRLSGYNTQKREFALNFIAKAPMEGS